MAKRVKDRITSKTRREIEEMVSCGMSEDDIARAMKFSTEALRRNFPEELLYGRSRRRREAIKLLFASARRGNVSAQKKLFEETAITGNLPRPEPKPKPLGKKEQDEAAASTAEVGTGWSDLVH